MKNLSWQQIKKVMFGNQFIELIILVKFVQLRMHNILFKDNASKLVWNYECQLLYILWVLLEWQLYIMTTFEVIIKYTGYI